MKQQLANTCNGLHVDIASSLEHLLDLRRYFLSIIRVFLQNNTGLLSTAEMELRFLCGDRVLASTDTLMGLNRLKLHLFRFMF